MRPNVNSETLLVHACETLASANVMATELSSSLTGPTCNLDQRVALESFARPVSLPQVLC
ncbi:DUF6124 family protein [Pseudomonas silesiensis]|uniref:DUF6124 family protein n=1 Tax=Pseudomonas silesiensis TaxID=1853130 RepID=UPI0038621579